MDTHLFRHQAATGNGGRWAGTSGLPSGLRHLVVAWFLALFLCVPATGFGAHLDVVPGEPFPDLTYPSLLEAGDYAKLGLDRTEGPVRLGEIPGKYLAIEFFNKSCRPCQRQVREMEQYYQGQVAEGDGTPRVRVLSVAVGNKAKYLPKYRRKRKITYPIAADPEFEQWRRLGDPGRTPFTVFLRRDGAAWVLNSYHFGIHDQDRLEALSEAMLAGVMPEVEGINVPPRADRSLEVPISSSALAGLASVILEQAAGRRVPVEVLEVGGYGTVYRARVAPSGKRLYARVGSRAPVCEVCHAVHFLYVFDESGVVLGFEPVQVTKYGNAYWSDEDTALFTRRLVGRRLDTLDFDPEVDTVTSATMTSALIYDEVRRSRGLLRELQSR